MFNKALGGAFVWPSFKLRYEQLRLNAWGFENSHLEEKYIDNYMKTFVVNNKQVYMYATCAWSVFCVFNLIGDLRNGDPTQIKIGSFITSCVLLITYCSTQRHLTSLYRLGMTLLFRVVWWFLPPALILMSTHGARSAVGTVVDVFAYATWGSFINPSFVGQCAILWSLALVPIAGALLQARISEAECVAWVGAASFVAAGGTLLSAWLSVSRRRKWVLQRRPKELDDEFETGRREGRDRGLRRRSRSRSPSPSFSPGRRSRSVPSLPRLDEDKGRPAPSDSGGHEGGEGQMVAG